MEAETCVDLRRAKSAWPGRGEGGASRDGWDPLVDGPMPEDSALAWRLWDAWLAADRSGDDEAAARA
ncbi:MAG: hypothetical protein AAFQ53_18215, partial [Bacteroidota bacterium]